MNSLRDGTLMVSDIWLWSYAEREECNVATFQVLDYFEQSKPIHPGSSTGGPVSNLGGAPYEREQPGYTCMACTERGLTEEDQAKAISDSKGRNYAYNWLPNRRR